MTSFEALIILVDNMVQYFTGSYAILGLLLSGIFLLVLFARGLDGRYAFTMALPLLAFFLVIGWFGSVPNNQWIINIGLVIVALIYAVEVIDLST